MVWWLLDGESPDAVDPDDPFWELEPGASGETGVSGSIDEALYGDS